MFTVELLPKTVRLFYCRRDISGRGTLTSPNGYFFPQNIYANLFTVEILPKMLRQFYCRRVISGRGTLTSPNGYFFPQNIYANCFTVDLLPLTSPNNTFKTIRRCWLADVRTFMPNSTKIHVKNFYTNFISGRRII